MRQHQATMGDCALRQALLNERGFQRPVNIRQQARAASVSLRSKALEAQRVIAISANMAAIAESCLSRVAGLAMFAKGLGLVRGRQ